MSQIYHGRLHDYTGYASIAIPFQSGKPIGEMIAWAMQATIPENDRPYFWTADDRGFSDYVNGAFRIFGPRVMSLYYFWFLLLFGSLTVAILRFKNDLPALAIVACTMIAIVAALPLYVRAPGLNFGEMSVNISETRMFEILGAIAAVHIILAALRPSFAQPLLNLGLLSFQVLLLFFLMHNRSSIAWLALALIGLALVTAAIRWRLKQPRKYVQHAAAVAGILVLGWVSLAVYHKAMLNSTYRGAIGPRTIWHNIVMGLSYNPTLAKVARISVIDDGAAAEAIVQDMRARADPRLTPDWNKQSILNSFGSHNLFDWRSYESAARGLVIRTLINNPGAALQMIFWDKPLTIIHAVRCQAMLIRAACYAPGADLKNAGPTLPDVKFQPLSLLSFGLLSLTALGLCLGLSGSVPNQSQSITRSLRTFAFSAAIIAALGIVPSLVFYPAITQLAGTILFGTLALYVCIVALLVGLAIWLTEMAGRLRKPAASI